MLIDEIQYFDKIKLILHLFITASARITVLSLFSAFFRNIILR